MTDEPDKGDDFAGDLAKAAAEALKLSYEQHAEMYRNLFKPIFPEPFDPSAFHSGGYIKPGSNDDIPVLLPRGEHYMAIHYPRVDKVFSHSVRPKVILIGDEVDALDPAILDKLRIDLSQKFDADVLAAIQTNTELTTPRWGETDADPLADLQRFTESIMDPGGQFKPGLGWFDPKIRERLWNRIDRSVHRRTMSKRAYRRWRGKQKGRRA